MTLQPEDSQSEEYTYSEETYQNAFPVKKPNPFSILAAKFAQQRGLIVAIVLIIIIYVVVKITHAIHHTSSTIESVPKTGPVITAQQLTPLQLKPKGTIPPPVTASSTENNSAATNTALANLDNKLYNMQYSMQGLNSGVQQIQKILSEQLAMQRALQKAQLDKMQYQAAKTYTVYAVIPNRAWLLSPQGNTITVQPGTIIQGLGKVTMINASAGTVTLNTGVTINYSSSDS